ncbi:hypothetical protein [Flavobacterium humidisoli]|uniref:Uncharacterized protein n=1 Tax=Flavobacterium humidisoli TaxID=2937442 RepID=A0ABY4LZZ8_9FLAO|nr:hypothetical protein [Flavobacterium humidisoli]UPZ18028.1 hypothetical protein M0M44_11935 [Flavobacterium humidisoli]
MKSLLRILPLFSLVFICCQNNKLDNRTAESMIVKKHQFPQEIDFEVFCNDPVHAKKMLDSGLEEKGFVEIIKVKGYKNRDKPLIEFTDSAKPFLLETTAEEREYKIQKVKIGLKKFGQIIQITAETNDKKMAVVDYIVQYEINEFGVLWPGLPEEKKEKAYFILSDNGWKIIDKKDAEIMMFKKIIEY